MTKGEAVLKRLASHLKGNVVAYIALMFSVIGGGGGYAIASTAHATKTTKKTPTAIVACASNTSGEMYLHHGTGKCVKGRHKVRWNLKGKQGKTGPAGPTGATGATGAPGATGATGPAGTPAPSIFAAVNADIAVGGGSQPFEQGMTVTRSAVGTYQVTITDPTCSRETNDLTATATARYASGEQVPPAGAAPLAYLDSNLGGDSVHRVRRLRGQRRYIHAAGLLLQLAGHMPRVGVLDRERSRWLPFASSAVAVLLATAVAVPAAHAGTYTARYVAGTGGCQLFSSANVAPGFLIGTINTISPEAQGTAAATAASGPICPTPGLTGGARGQLAIIGGYPSAAAGGSGTSITTTAPAGVTITGAQSTLSQSGPIGEDGWSTSDFYAGGGNDWTGDGDGVVSTGPISSGTWSIAMNCASGASTCAANPPGTNPVLNVSAVTFTASETQAPAISSSGTGDLFNETGGYVWNPPGDVWTIPLTASDPSGVCNATAVINGNAQILESQAANTYAWQQCADGSWSTTTDTRQYVPAAGTLPVTLEATNAAQNTASAAQTIQVDNDPVSVTLATPNDANPTVWVDHPVQIASAASAGPSGISSQGCSIDNGPGFGYPAGGFAVDGDGTHSVSCTAANNAVDPQGAHNTGTATENVAIDEAAPQLAFAPVNPGNPDQITVDTSDAESGVASASLTVQGPHATTAAPVPSTLSGGQLTADFNDGGKNGTYTFVATSCDQVGNCASTSEALHFPIRLGTRQLMSFQRIVVPAATIHKQIKLAARVKTITRHEKVDGKTRAVKKTVYFGAQTRRVAVHVKTDRRCGQHTIHYRAHGKRRRRQVTACRTQMNPRVIAKHRQPLGNKVKLYGRVLSTQGAPVADAPVQISTRPRYAGGTWTEVKTVDTDSAGYWTARLSGGPSRIIRARYLGSDDTEPATSRVRLTVPAKIRLSITPRVLPWTGAVTIRGHLVGSYVPPDGVALRLLVRYPHAKQWTVLEALRTNKHGAFEFQWSYNAGQGVITYPFRISSTATESDYPYAAGSSRAVRVTFGKATPRHARRGRYHKRHAHQHHKRHHHDKRKR